MNPTTDWPASVWAQINGTPATGTTPAQPGLLLTAMGAIRIAQKVFLPTVQGNDTPVAADTVDLKTGLPTVGITRPLASVTRQFQLADLHVDPNASPGLPMLANQVNLAAQALASLEDALIFQGKKAHIPHGLTVVNAEHLEDGLLGVAEKNHTIPVPAGRDGAYGMATYKAVIEGISHFSATAQTVPFALILDPKTYADANAPLLDNAGVTPANFLTSILQGGLYASPGMPSGTGLLAAGLPTGATATAPAPSPAGAAATTAPTLATGAITSVIIGTPPTLEYTNTDGKYYYFTARESVQFYNIDARALIKLEFREPAASPKKI